MGMWLPERQSVKTLTQMQVNRRKGLVFSASHLFTEIADGSSAEVVGITGATKVGLTIMVKSTGQAEIEFEKGTDLTSNGTEMLAVNRKEKSSNTANATIYHSPTVDTAGTIFSYGLIPGGGGAWTTTGGETEEARYGIDSNSTHLMRATNTSGSADQKILIKLLWVEH